jgi:DNA modification methylase
MLKRNWIGSEINKEYCEVIEQRLKQAEGLF